MDDSPDRGEEASPANNEAAALGEAEDGYTDEAFAASEAYAEDHGEAFAEAPPPIEFGENPRDHEASTKDEASSSSSTPLMDLNDAISRIPEELREQMGARLRAEFREVRRYRKK